MTYLQPISHYPNDDVISDYRNGDVIGHNVEYTSHDSKITVKELMSYMWQIAKGMEYLSGMKVRSSGAVFF